jgi:hypothetical protein
MARSMVVILCPHPEDEVRECDPENCHAAKERIGGLEPPGQDNKVLSFDKAVEPQLVEVQHL